MDEITDFFDEMDQLDPRPGHIVIMPCPGRPWIKKYAWLAAGAPPTVPVATPTHDHSFWVAVRNLSIEVYRVAFACESQNGRIRFDKSDPPGYRFEAELIAPPATREGRTKPNYKASAIATDGNSDSLEVVWVRARTRAATVDRQVGDEEFESLSLLFPD